MQEHEYRARDKTVKKMSRDGLKEENLHSRKSIRVSNRETDDFFCATQAEDMEDFSKRGERAEDTKSAKKKLYSEKAGRTEAAETVGQDMEKSGKKRAASRKMRIPESESARWQEEIEEADSNTGERLSDYSSRVESIRGHPSGAREYAEAAAWTSHSRKKQQVQSYVRRERAEKTAEEKQTAQKEKESSRFRKNQETAEQSMEGFREEIKGKIKREQLHKEQKKQAGRLSFGDESSGMIQGAGIGMAKKAVSAGTVAASAYVHGKSHEAEQENAAVEGAHKAELLGEKTVRYAVSRSSRRLQESLHTERQAEKTAEAGRLQFEAMKKKRKRSGETRCRGGTVKEECYFTLLAEKALQTGLCCGEGREKSNGGYHPGYRNHCGQSKEGTAGDSLQEPGNFRRYRCLRIVVRSDGSLTQQLQRQHSGRQYHNYFYHLCQRG